MQTPALLIRHLNRQDYLPIWQAMQHFTDNRTQESDDEIWFVEHNPVFTQGQAGKPEHLLNPTNIPIIQSDRGGQITYHGPGQLIAYFLINLRRKNIGVRELVTHIENIVIQTLQNYGIEATARADAPGVYVNNKKICSLGLRIRKGYSFHGFALNIDMDLTPFSHINPCGYAGMEMTQLASLGVTEQLKSVENKITENITSLLNYPNITHTSEMHQL